VSAARKWFVKVMVVLAVNFALALVLPCVLRETSAWLTGIQQLVLGIPGQVSPLLIANLVLLAAAIDASSAATNSLRAIAGTIVLFVFGGASVPICLMSGALVRDIISHQAILVRYPAWWDTWDWMEPAYWFVGWLTVVACAYWLAFRNFRSALGVPGFGVLRAALVILGTTLFCAVGLNWEQVACIISHFAGN
jgi:hypothetical protein